MEHLERIINHLRDIQNNPETRKEYGNWSLEISILQSILRLVNLEIMYSNNDGDN